MCQPLKFDMWQNIKNKKNWRKKKQEEPPMDNKKKKN